MSNSLIHLDYLSSPESLGTREYFPTPLVSPLLPSKLCERPTRRTPILAYSMFLVGTLSLGASIYTTFLTSRLRDELLKERFYTSYRFDESDAQFLKVGRILTFLLKPKETIPETPLPPAEAASLPITQATNATEIATVTVQKANLRTEPRADASVLMILAADTKLLIQEENGDWYKVTAPTGETAWISKSIVSLDTSAQG